MGWSSALMLSRVGDGRGALAELQERVIVFRIADADDVVTRVRRGGQCRKLRKWRSRRQKILRRDRFRCNEHVHRVLGHTVPP